MKNLTGGQTKTEEIENECHCETLELIADKGFFDGGPQISPISKITNVTFSYPGRVYVKNLERERAFPANAKSSVQMVSWLGLDIEKPTKVKFYFQAPTEELKKEAKRCSEEISKLFEIFREYVTPLY